MGKIQVLQFLGDKWLRLIGLFLLLPAAVLYAQPRPGIRIGGRVLTRGETVTICINTSITYLNEASGTVTQMRWRFKNGTPNAFTGFGPPPIFYNQAGIDTTWQTVTDGSRSDSTFVLVRVTDVKPVANFSFAPSGLCASVPIVFTNQSSGGSGLNYVWNFGDGKPTVTTANPTKIFETNPAGPLDQNFNVKLVATNNGNCADSITKIVTVRRTPDPTIAAGDPNFEYLPNFNGVPTFRRCENIPTYEFAFRNATSTHSQITKYTIKWGDGSPDSIFTSWPLGFSNLIKHRFARGNTTMTIIVTGDDGCEGIRVYNVFLGTTPAGGFASRGNTSICAPNGLTFAINETENNAPGTIYRVTVNDNTPPVVFSHPAPAEVTHIFEKTSCNQSSSNGANVFNNSYRAVLDVENPCGTTSVSVIPIYVSGKPKADWVSFPESPDICVNTAVTFYDNNTYGGKITPTGGTSATCDEKGKWVWTISPSTGYTILSGQLGTTNGRPDEGFFWTSGSNPIQVRFTQTGTYKIKIYAANDLCGVDSIVKEICVRNPPEASFTMDKKNACSPVDIAYNNTSQTGPCNGENFLWTITYADIEKCGTSAGYTFIDGTSSTTRDAKVRFTAPGRYIMELRVSTKATGCSPAYYRDTFYAVSKPRVDLGNFSGLCAGNALSPTATVNNCYGVGTPENLWTFTGGTPATSTNLIPGLVNYAANGSYLVALASTNDCGTTTATKTIIVGPRPLADAGNDKEVCSKSSVSLGVPGIAGVTYSWSPNTGLSNANVANPSLNFNYTGFSADTTMQFVVQASTAIDCYNTDTVLVTVKRTPVVNINPAAPIICTGGSVQLTASGAEQYVWSPATGLSATDLEQVTASPVITTTYNLKGSLANGCFDLKPVTVTVTNRPVVNAGRDTLACNNAPNTVLTGSPNGGTWSGSTHVTGAGVFNPRNAGNGIYKLYYSFIANGCDGTDSMLVTVQNPPASNAGRDTSICADGTIYKLAGTPAGGVWSGSSLVNAAGDFTASTPGVYELIYNRGSGSCIGYDTVKVTVVNTVSNNTITATQGVCSGVVPAQLIGSSASAGGLSLSYQWQSSPDSLNWTNIAGETGKDLVIPSPIQTIFYRRLANTSVCTNGSPSNGVRIFIQPNALADIKPAPLVACAPFDISPSVVKLTAYPDRNSIYRWYAGNSLIGTGETFPGYRINNPDDSIIIKLVTISRFGCVNDSASVQFKTVSNPSPSFTLSDTVGCGPLQIAITSTTPRPERYSFLWNLGNGQTISTAQPGIITYPINPSLGDTIYTVMLRATGGCDTFTVEKKIRVRARPRTLFTPDKAEGCSPFTVTYNNNSAGSNASFEWDFGDGSPRVPAGFNSVSHTYFTGRLDTFRVRLFGTNDCGTDTGRFNLVVNPNRVRLDFAVNGDELNGCAPHTVTFINNTTGGNLFRWNFGDGSPVLTTNKGFDTVRHTYADTGRYVVNLFGTNGCSDTTSTEIINVSKMPLVSFSLTPSSICLGAPFSLNNTSEQGLAWNWSFGDGTTSTLRTPVKNYTTAGTYRVVLKGTRQFAQGFSCTDSVVSTINVIAPTGDWRYRGGYYCAGQPAFFEVTNSNATRYRFYFGNGDSVVTTSPNVSYTFPQPGLYLPRVVLEYLGCLRTLPGMDSIRVDKTATGFTSSAIQSCGATRVDFRDTSSAYFGISSWFWQFGDGTVSNQRNPTKIFNQAGTYPISLRITGLSGCTDTMRTQLNVSVQQPPVISISGDTVACVGQLARFTAFDVSNSATVFDWTITGGASQGGSSATNTWVQTGLYQLRLIGRSVFGCADTAYRFIRVNPAPIISAGNDVTICRGQNTRLTATGNTTLTWSPVQGLSCSVCANPQAGPNLTTQYFVSGINSFGCRATDSILVSVAQPFKISVTANDTICASLNESAQLFASGTYRYEWNPSLGLNAANIPNPVARPASTTLYRVIGLDAENCFTDTAFVRVAVGYNPTVNLPNGVQVVAGTQVLLNAQYTGGPFSRYTWTPDTDLSCNNCPAPIATVNVNTRYTVVAETIYGCTASDTAVYTVECQKDQVYIPNAFSPDGDGVNDILMVRGKGVAMVKSFRVFNRFGQVVFEKQNFAANDPTAGWNGRIGGNPASADVYVYTAEVQCTSGGVMFTYKGNVTLFR